MLDAISDPLLILLETRIVAANGAAAELVGRELVGEEIERLLPATALGAGDTSGIAVEIGGSGRSWEVRASEIGDGRRLLHLIDRTAVKAAERMRVDFVANASHELRTPIAAISGFTETLMEDEAGGDPETRRRFLGVIAREARRMQRLVEDLMSLSRIEAEQHVTPVATVDFAVIAQEAALAAAEQRAPRGADLVFAPMAGELFVKGDAPQLAQLAHNLVSNGFKYGRPGTPVTVSIKRRDGLVVLSVEDEGEGIPAIHLSRITQRFYRVNAGRSRAVGGTGLGLAIVKHIVERHGGRLEIDSEEGRGTCVTVALPAAEPDTSRHRTVT